MFPCNHLHNDLSTAAIWVGARVNRHAGRNTIQGVVGRGRSLGIRKKME